MWRRECEKGFQLQPSTPFLPPASTMASPPSSQIPALALPKKRPATTAISTTGLNPKRRKPSSAGPSNLRQTSFPPEGDLLSAPPLSALSPPTSAFGGPASRFSREPSLESSSVLRRGGGAKAAAAPSVVSGRSGRAGGGASKGGAVGSNGGKRSKSKGTSSVGRPKSASVAGAEDVDAEAPDDDDGEDDDEGGLDMELDANMMAGQSGDAQKEERANVAHVASCAILSAC